MIKTLAEIMGYIEKADLEKDIETFYKWREEARRTMKEEKGERGAIHVNLISQTEMKAHAKEMRAENDRKFVECLMVQGLTKLEALKRVNEWNARGSVANYDC